MIVALSEASKAFRLGAVGRVETRFAVSEPEKRGGVSAQKYPDAK